MVPKNILDYYHRIDCFAPKSLKHYVKRLAYLTEGRARGTAVLHLTGASKYKNKKHPHAPTHETTATEPETWWETWW